MMFFGETVNIELVKGEYDSVAKRQIQQYRDAAVNECV